MSDHTCEFSRGNHDCDALAVSVIEMPPNAPKRERYACERHTELFAACKIPPPIRLLAARSPIRTEREQ